MNLHIKVLDSYNLDYLKGIFEIDEISYSEELSGAFENMCERAKKCLESFILLFDDEKLIGYVNVFPIANELHKVLLDKNDATMFDDDITPEQMQDWEKNCEHNLFVISVAIIPQYRRTYAIKVLGDYLLEYFREKDNSGYKINSIIGIAVSSKGKNFMKRFRSSFYKDIEGGYEMFNNSREDIETLLKDGLLLEHN